MDDGFGDTARLACPRVALALLLACTSVDELASVPLLGLFAGGDELLSVSEESTIGCFRAARGFTMPPQRGRTEMRSAANGHAWTTVVGAQTELDANLRCRGLTNALPQHFGTKARDPLLAGVSVDGYR